MALLDEYTRVTDEVPCPICGSPDWCLIHNEGRKCICQRIESGKRYGDAGWLHYLADGAVPKRRIRTTPKQYLTHRQVRSYLTALGHAGINHKDMLIRHSKLLGVSYSSLLLMHATYCPDSASVVFPMFNGSCQPIGARFRRGDGRKWSLRNGREGLFLSRRFDANQPVFVAEGPTDAAALVSAQIFNVVGRPNCTGGSSTLADLLRNAPHTPVVVLSDPKEQEVDGAVKLAQALNNPCLVLVGDLDIRDWFSTFHLPSDCRRAILKSVGEGASNAWKPRYRNYSGEGFDFTRVAKT